MKLPKIGISIGDINGVGPEIIIESLSTEYYTSRFIPVIYGSAKVLAYYKNVVGNADFSFVSIDHADQARSGKVSVINCWMESVKIELGQITEASGQAAYTALDRATTDLRDGHIDALVTAPINKKAMRMAMFQHLGHTEYIAEKMGQSGDELMMLISEELRVAVISTHIPIAEAASYVQSEHIIKCATTMNTALKQDFGIEKPIIALLGLNPHASDNGEIGTEEEMEILPAIAKLKDNGVLVAGPFAADGFFGSDTYKKFDGVLAMYHDQGLVPFKTISFGSGVNFTAGLSVIRTSPDHGTGHDIVGKNVASGRSMTQAIYAALDIYRNRSLYLESHADIVEKVKINSEVDA